MYYTRDRKEKTERNRKAAFALSKDQKRHKWRYEMLFKQFLERENIYFVFQKPFWSDKWFYCVDFFIPILKLVIEIDGSTHKRRRDSIRTRNLIRSGKVKEVIRIKNNELKNDPGKVYNEVILKLKESI